MSGYKNIAGRRFGKLIAIEVDRNVGTANNTYWLCRCDCGTVRVVAAPSLTRGASRSCGCLASEASAERMKAMHRSAAGEAVADEPAKRARGNDLTGQRFGRLTVVRVSRSDSKHRYWECRCDCGRTHIAETSALTNGSTRSCGCLRREKSAKTGRLTGGNNIKDLTGRRFGRWTVLRFVKREKRSTWWECRCDCGTVRLVTTNNLTSGSSKSCGCLSREVAAEHMKQVRRSRPARPAPEPAMAEHAKAAPARTEHAGITPAAAAPARRPLVAEEEVDILFNIIHRRRDGGRSCSV